MGTQRELDDDWKLKQWTSYFNTPFDERDRILNLISMEFSTTKLAKIVNPPSFVDEIGWVENLWPKTKKDRAKHPTVCGIFLSLYGNSMFISTGKRIFVIQVQLYCLMSSQDSFTEFHIDFGGSSVWYNVVKGKKVR